jgi:hypothetical protein
MARLHDRPTRDFNEKASDCAGFLPASIHNAIKPQPAAESKQSL